MVKRFEPTAKNRAAIEKAMARLDAQRVRKDKAAQARARDKAKRRKRERDVATRLDVSTVRNLPTALKQRHAIAGWRVLLARMEPGTWYTFAETRVLIAEYPTGSAKAWLMQKLPARGLIERAGNPDYDPRMLRPGQSGARYLYGLSIAGAQEGRQARLDLGAVSETGKSETAL